MTDTGNGERPLTRRELRALERAQAEAAAAQAAPADDAAVEQSPTTADADASPDAPEEPSVAAEAASADAASADEAAEERVDADVEPAESAEVEEPASESSPEADPETAQDDSAAQTHDEPQPTQAMSIDELLAEEARADEPAVDPVEEPAAEPEAAPVAPPSEKPAKRGIGRFFGRKTLDETAKTEAPADFDQLLEGETSATEPTADAEATDVAADSDEQPASTPSADETAEVAEVVEVAETPEVDGPARARGLKLDESRRQHLDDVSDDDLDLVEIDEIEAPEGRVSAAAVSDKTPAQLEDTRGESFEADEEVKSGPARGRGSRLPFVVNVVEDTSEHHISDLRRGGDRIESQNVGTSTSSITANALVLPATGQEDEIQFESEDGVLVTGSIDLPDGYVSSGRARGKFDSADIDSSSDGSEVSNPETAPVRASRAVSSYANARVSIAPKRQSRSLLPWALGVGGGVVFAGILVVVIGYTAGWF